MNILQVNCVYGTGSTGNITRDLHRTFLALGHRSTVLYGRGPRAEEPFTCQVCSDRYGRAQAWLPGLGDCPTATAPGPPAVSLGRSTGSGRMWCTCNASTGTFATCTTCSHS